VKPIKCPMLLTLIIFIDKSYKKFIINIIITIIIITIIIITITIFYMYILE